MGVAIGDRSGGEGETNILNTVGIGGAGGKELV